jgi:hypothetical protein
LVTFATMMKVITVLFGILIAQTAAFSAPSSVANPKKALSKLVVQNLKTDPTKLNPKLVIATRDEIATLLDSLYHQNKGFSADTVQGEWTIVMSLPGETSRKQQSLVGNRVEKAGSTLQNYNIDQRKIGVTVFTPRENGKIEATLAYNPVPANFSQDPNGKIVLRRIACDNVKATFKYKWLPRITIPFFKKKGGWLDFVYLDKDFMVTKGSRGGTFVHMRKESLDKIMTEY